jgi:hypothetical protein
MFLIKAGAYPSGAPERCSIRTKATGLARWILWKLSISLSKLENVINLAVPIRVMTRAYLITVSNYYVVTLARPEMVPNTLAYYAESKVEAKNELYHCCQFCSFRHSPLPRMSSFHWPLCFQKISCLPTFGPIRCQFHKHFTRVTYDRRKISWYICA